MALLTLGLFVVTSVAMVGIWNRFFAAVPWRVALVLWAFCAAYQCSTLVTSRVDLPANLAYVAYPWRAIDRPTVRANTGIIFTQIAPWTRIARDAVGNGEVPLWNRHSAAGAPLLANQQTAIYHPFTLLGMLLPIGKAFTLSSSLRLFFVAFFTFVLLRNWRIGTAASIFGAIAYTFCSFHVVWLLFPLGLATMMLPLCLVGVQELLREKRFRAYLGLVFGLGLSILGGHPESALWVWLATSLFGVYACLVAERGMRLRSLFLVASAFVMAMMLTSFFWYPTLRALRETPRFSAMNDREANPADHDLSAEWLLPLIAPNVLGTPVNGTYSPPRGFHPAVLNDYGEVASSYAGLATLGLALAAPLVNRGRPFSVAIALMLLSFLTFAEAPWWRDAVRAVPLAGISIHQRLRIFWNLGICIAAALSVDAAVRGERRGRIALSLVATMAAFGAVYALRTPPFLRDSLGLAHFVIPLATAALVTAVLRRKWLPAWATLLVFLDLVVATARYNPTARASDVYPVTGAIAALQEIPGPTRVAAMGWSFIPDTPGYYGLEDVKTTDPVQHARYMRMMKGYLNVDPASYDQLIRDVSQPFFDYLNIGSIYVPPDYSLADPRFVEIYRGPDGAVLRNNRVLPRYFLVRGFQVEPSFDQTVWRSKQIADFRTQALVDHVPAMVLREAPVLNQPGVILESGSVRVVRYGAGNTVLDVTSRGWNLLVSSDVHWPGWRAYWNGRRQPPVVVNGAFLGCFVPPGRGELVFRYAPDEFTHALRVSAAAALLLMLAGLIVWKRKLRRGTSTRSRSVS